MPAPRRPTKRPPSHATSIGRRALAVAAALTALVACGTPGDTTQAGPATESTRGTDPGRLASAPRRPRVVALGDSLTAGYGLPPDQSYPSVLQRLLDSAGYEYEVVNMGVSGDTSAGGLRRIDWALEGDVRVLIVALGGNDGLRGLSPPDLERNLGAIIGKARERDVEVLLCGMEAPPNLGASYTRDFRAVYPRLAGQEGVILLPFLLEGIAGDPGLNQSDGIHPNAEGARRMAGLVFARLEPLLGRADQS